MSEDNNEIQNPEEMIKKISKQLYNDEYFIEKAIYTEKAQQNKTFTFFRDDTKNDIQKYCWCQRPCDINMSLDRFLINGTIEAFMSESLAESRGLAKIDLNEFIWKFVQPIIKENIQIKKENDELKNHVHYKKCLACGKEFKAKRSDAKYCVLCGKFVTNRNYYLNLTEEQKAKRRENSKMAMRRLRENAKEVKDE